MTGSVKPPGGLMASAIKLTLDAQPKAGQPGLLNVTGLRGAMQGANLAVVPPPGQATPNRMLMLNYTGGLTGPPSIPLTAESDTLTVPVQYPVKPGPVGVTGIIGFEGTPALQQGTSPKRNPSLERCFLEEQSESNEKDGIASHDAVTRYGVRDRTAIAGADSQ